MRKLVLAVCAAAVAVAVPVSAMAQQPAAVRVGGQVQAPERISYVPPVYPAIAKAARVSGIVIAEAVVGADGAVTDARIIRSIALLDEAALNAVRQWRYSPSLMNGRPVPVIMTVTVAFKLDDDQMNTTASGTSTTPTQTVASFTPSPNEPVQWNGRDVLRIGGNVKAPERVKYVAPVYPQEAQDARVAGIVIMELIVDETGHVATAKVLRSIALLDQAAMDSVMQWEYTPTTLNGAPVPVLMTVTVNFTLK